NTAPTNAIAEARRRILVRSPSFCTLIYVLTSMLHAQTATLTLGSGTAAPGGTVTVPLTLSGMTEPAAIEWTFSFSSDVTSVVVAAGPAAVAASKSRYCRSGTGLKNCLLVGLNQNAISDGQV